VSYVCMCVCEELFCRGSYLLSAICLSACSPYSIQHTAYSCICMPYISHPQTYTLPSLTYTLPFQRTYTLPPKLYLCPFNTHECTYTVPYVSMSVCHMYVCHVKNNKKTVPYSPIPSYLLPVKHIDALLYVMLQRPHYILQPMSCTATLLHCCTTALSHLSY
jgi:hypothetical protein